MKKWSELAGLLLLAAGMVMSGCARNRAPEFVQDPALRVQLEAFAMEKERQAQALAAASGQALPSKAETVFSAIATGDWATATNNYADLRSSFKGDQIQPGSWWQPVLETYGAAELFTLGDPKYATAYGHDIIESIPPGSIYFGGTDPGRFIVTAMEKSQMAGEPFFDLTQNGLSDGGYLDYLRSMYGARIFIPTAADLQKCFDDYFSDFQKRRAAHELMPGEDIARGPGGKWHVNSYMSLIQVKELVAKEIFEKNTNQEFYVEESFPFAWMYPNLEPHGLILKLHHEPLTALPEDSVRMDHDYWTNAIMPMIGGWLNNDTTVARVAAFAEKVYLRQDFSGFTGDPAFVENADAHRMFSKERSSIASLYAWRSQHDGDAADKRRMDAAADFAFRQAWALCPYSPEAVFRYVTFLMRQKRIADALVVAETAAKFRSEPGVGQLDQLVANLKRFEERH